MTILSGSFSYPILGKRKDRSQFAEGEDAGAAAAEFEDAAAAAAEFEDAAAVAEVEDAAIEVENVATEVEDAAAEVEDAAIEVEDAAAEVEDAAAEVEDAAAEVEDAAAAEVEDAAPVEYEDEDGARENKCRICLQFGHWTYLCPNKRLVPEGIEIVGPGWVLVCYHCGLDEFNPDKSCVSCRTTFKRISRMFCGICGVNTHQSRDCPYEGMVDLTSNFDFYVPPPAGAQVVCTIR